MVATAGKIKTQAANPSRLAQRSTHRINMMMAPMAVRTRGREGNGSFQWLSDAMVKPLWRDSWSSYTIFKVVRHKTIRRGEK